jgi:hypothetical protein
MASTVEIGKLAELRRKTDQDLIRVIHTMLERGLILTSVATDKQSPLYRQAENLYRQAEALLSKVYSLSNAEKVAVTLRLLELDKALTQVPAEEPRWQMAGRG